MESSFSSADGESSSSRIWVTEQSSSIVLGSSPSFQKMSSAKDGADEATDKMKSAKTSESTINVKDSSFDSSASTEKEIDVDGESDAPTPGPSWRQSPGEKRSAVEPEKSKSHSKDEVVNVVCDDDDDDDPQIPGPSHAVDGKRRSSKEADARRPEGASKVQVLSASDSEVSDCPPTPKHMPAGLRTPVRSLSPEPCGSHNRARIKKKKRRSKSLDNRRKSGSDSSGDERGDGSCPICLGKLDDKAMTDTCLHKFCFTCLLEWSKVKPVCPLCKGTFKSIIHNIRSDTDYDQHTLPPSEPSTVMEPLEFFHIADHHRRFTYHTDMAARHMERRRYQIARQLRNMFLPSFPDRTSAREIFRRRRGAGTTDFRRSIYSRDLWAQPLADITGRMRECSPEWYRTNEAQIHRLAPFLNRELLTLLHGTPHEAHVARLATQLTDWVTRFEIRSPEMRDHLLPYLGINTEHFQHEFYCFARSPYDLVGYDRNTQYERRRLSLTVVSSDSSSSTSSDDERTTTTAGTARGEPRPAVAAESRDTAGPSGSSDSRRSEHRGRDRDSERRRSGHRCDDRNRDRHKRQKRKKTRRENDNRDGRRGESHRHRGSSSRTRDGEGSSRDQGEGQVPDSMFSIDGASNNVGIDLLASAARLVASRDGVSRAAANAANRTLWASEPAEGDRNASGSDRNRRTESGKSNSSHRRKSKKPSRYMRVQDDIRRNFPHLLPDEDEEDDHVAGDRARGEAGQASESHSGHADQASAPKRRVSVPVDVEASTSTGISAGPDSLVRLVIPSSDSSEDEARTSSRAVKTATASATATSANSGGSVRPTPTLVNTALSLSGMIDLVSPSTSVERPLRDGLDAISSEDEGSRNTHRSRGKETSRQNEQRQESDRQKSLEGDHKNNEADANEADGGSGHQNRRADQLMNIPSVSLQPPPERRGRGTDLTSLVAGIYPQQQQPPSRLEALAQQFQELSQASITQAIASSRILYPDMTLFELLNTNAALTSQAAGLTGSLTDHNYPGVFTGGPRPPRGLEESIEMPFDLSLRGQPSAGDWRTGGNVIVAERGSLNNHSSAAVPSGATGGVQGPAPPTGGTSGSNNTTTNEQNEDEGENSDLEVLDVVASRPRKPREPEVVELSSSSSSVCDSEDDADNLRTDTPAGGSGRSAAQMAFDPNEPIEISSGSDHDEPTRDANNHGDEPGGQPVDPVSAVGSSKGKGQGKKRKRKSPTPPQASSSDDDLIVVKTEYSTIDPVTKKEIVEPVRNKKCNHIYEKSTIYTMINIARENGKWVRCPYVGCNCRDFKKTDLVKDKEVMAYIEKVKEEREQEKAAKAEKEREERKRREDAKRQRLEAAGGGDNGNDSDKSADSIIDDVIEMIRGNKGRMIQVNPPGASEDADAAPPGQAAAEDVPAQGSSEPELTAETDPTTSAGIGDGVDGVAATALESAEDPPDVGSPSPPVEDLQVEEEEENDGEPSSPTAADKTERSTGKRNGSTRNSSRFRKKGSNVAASKKAEARDSSTDDDSDVAEEEEMQADDDHDDRAHNHEDEKVDDDDDDDDEEEEEQEEEAEPVSRRRAEKRRGRPASSSSMSAAGNPSQDKEGKAKDRSQERKRKERNRDRRRRRDDRPRKKERRRRAQSNDDDDIPSDDDDDAQASAASRSPRPNKKSSRGRKKKKADSRSKSRESRKSAKANSEASSRPTDQQQQLSTGGGSGRSKSAAAVAGRKSPATGGASASSGGNRKSTANDSGGVGGGSQKKKGKGRPPGSSAKNGGKSSMGSEGRRSSNTSRSRRAPHAVSYAEVSSHEEDDEEW